MQTTENTLPAWAEAHSESTKAEILALQTKANSALSRARALEAKASNEGRDLDAVELDFIDSQMDAFSKFQNEIQGYQSAGRKVAPQPGRLGHNFGDTTAKPGSFAALFGAPADTRQFKDLGAFARAVAVNDPKLFTNAAGMSGTVGADGGYMVPAGFLSGLIDGSLQAEAIRPRATVVPMPAPETRIPLFDTRNRASSLAGLEPEILGEGDTGTNQKGLVTYATMHAHKSMILVPCTQELLDDSGPTFTALLQKYMVESLSQSLDDGFINGGGGAVAQGIVGAACAVSVAKETSQVAATVVPQNLAKMVARLAPGSFGKAVWLASPSVLSSLFVMAVNVRNVANTENVGGFQPGWFTVLPDGTYSLLGRPLIVSDRCQQLGTVGDIVLSDLTQYLIGIRQDATLKVDSSVGFKSDEIYFRLTIRIDGMPLLAGPITGRNGTDTLSPFVTLATRA